MSIHQHHAARRIVPPPEFPVVWPDPQDEQFLWTQHSQFFPGPVTPMTNSFLAEAHDPAFNQVCLEYGYPTGFLWRRINGFRYWAWAVDGVPADTLHGWEQRVEEHVRAECTHVDDLWTRELLPEIQEHLRTWEAVDLRIASVPALHAHLNETVRRRRRLHAIETRLGLLDTMALSLFDDLYRDLLGIESDCDAYRLLQGFDNKTIETDRALWDLSRNVLTVGEVRAVLVQTPAAQIVSILQRWPAGQRFLAELRDFLTTYGQRSDVYMELAHPFWIEDPTTPITYLQEHLAQPDDDPRVELTARAVERERLLAKLHQQFAGHATSLRVEFERMLRAAQGATMRHEDHNYWLDCRASYQVRRVLLECGRRLAEAGALEQRDDVFYLTLDELRDALDRLPHIELAETATQRRTQFTQFRRLVPPPVLGTEPEPGSPHVAVDPDTAFGRMLTRMAGTVRPTEAGTSVVRGNAGSPGIARGRARVVRTLAEAGKLHPGDVLVTRTTVPVWTPLFATASAVVTEVGGILSHCAIVAREYGIPAVVGTASATTTIQDGQLVEVDGSAGVVRILS